MDGVAGFGKRRSFEGVIQIKEEKIRAHVGETSGNLPPIQLAR